MYPRIVKRLFDFLFATAALILLLPFLFLITIALLISNNGNPFFIQPRPGKNSKIFKLIKFKTMNDKRDENGSLLHDSQRLTKLGKLIRAFSIDELPQLINVINGEMSMIGPRPLLVEYLPLYDIRQARRHEVRPGITGWAQVNGRNAISWEEKFELDLYYVENLSFWLDVRILFLTIVKVFKREGINQHGQATVDTFKGENERLD